MDDKNFAKDIMLVLLLIFYIAIHILFAEFGLLSACSCK